MAMLAKRSVVAIALLAIIASCGKPDLSRSAAQTLIRASDAFQRFTQTIPLHARATEDGLEQGIWRLDSDRVVLAEKATATISSAARDSIVLKSAASIKVVVTGISDVPGTTNQKEALFTWEYDQLPSIARRFAVKGGNGRAIFRLFDDGWRLETAAAQADAGGFVLSAQENDEIAADMEAEATRRRLAQEAVIAAAAALKRRIHESKIPTRAIEEYSFRRSPYTYTNPPEYYVKITDANVVFKDFDGLEWTVWFGNIEEVKLFSQSRSLWADYDYGIIVTLRSGVTSYTTKSMWQTVPSPVKSLTFGIRREFVNPRHSDETTRRRTDNSAKDEEARVVSVLRTILSEWQTRYSDLPASSLTE
jgi:hypothetical protein